MEIRYQYHKVNGLQLHVGHAGLENKKLMVMLHGFPEFSYGWKHQAEFFAARGYHVVIPDQRGYNLSDKPKGVAAYRLVNLVEDIAALISSLTNEKVVLVGHDWGGAVAWSLAQHKQGLVEKLIILNMPHLHVMRQHLKSNPKQLLKSWYAAFFQLPVLPEKLCSAFKFRWMKLSMTKSANPGTFSEEELLRYRESWRQPYALTAMINWYRAFRMNKLKINLDVLIPTLIVWGRNDAFLNEKMAEDSLARCPNGRLVMLDEATHWLHHEKPDAVNTHILSFL